MNDVQFGMNQYCGPAVLSIFTGLDTDFIAQQVTEITGRPKVTGVMPSDLIRVGEKLGLEFKENQAFQDRSLFWTASALVNFPGNYLITIPNHYITLEVTIAKQIFICDNHTKIPMDLQNSSRLSQKVERVWKVTKVFDYVIPEKPKLVSSITEAEFNGQMINFVKINKLSDGSFKRFIIGHIKIENTMEIRMVTSNLIELVRQLDDKEIGE